MLANRFTHQQIIAAVTLVIAAIVFDPSSLHSQTTDSRPLISAHDCARSNVQSLKANVVWKSNERAIKWGEWRVRLGENKLPILIVVVVVAPKQTRLSLDIVRDGNELKTWSLANAPTNARFAVNAGQFTDAGPWGWVVHRGHEQQAPGVGSLAGALVVDSLGSWSMLDASEITARRTSGNVMEAIQSYPTLIGANGRVPNSLCAGSNGIDRTHRDARLIVGTLTSGELILAMTRFDGLGTTAERLPLGPTTPEMISIMRALGATRALMLDGGLSAQMMIRSSANGGKTEWAGLRSVPLALIGLPLPLR
ncbi:MAG: phosphodiester glycosidase family protein [Gemmatimonadaceae bacterium]